MWGKFKNIGESPTYDLSKKVTNSIYPCLYLLYVRMFLICVVVVVVRCLCILCVSQVFLYLLYLRDGDMFVFNDMFVFGNVCVFGSMFEFDNRPTREWCSNNSHGCSGYSILTKIYLTLIEICLYHVG